MRKILGEAKTVKQLLKGIKYSIDYYQREYKWEKKHIDELVNDLVTKFYEGYEENHERKRVADYPHYFLGSIIISSKDSANFIVDGQQRLTSLTLFIILLNNLRRDRTDVVQLEDLIFSEKYGEKSFNLDVKERNECISALFLEKPYDVSDAPETVQNLHARYQDINSAFPIEMRNSVLPYFVDWLLDNVHLVEITAHSDGDAYTIFETMNDRGLSLRPTDMLKGFLLANIDDDNRDNINRQWKTRVQELAAWGKEVDAECFKAWFRSQYSKKIRERKRDARQEDFERIGAEFHRWVRDATRQIGLVNSSDFVKFVSTEFEFYSKQYLRLLSASESIAPQLEHVRYNSCNGFTLQYMILLASLKPGDSGEVIDKKLRITAKYLDIMITWRIWNFRSIGYSTMQYAMFLVMRGIRKLTPSELAHHLLKKLHEEKENFDNNSDYHSPGIGLSVHQQNRKALHHILARLTDFVAVQSGQAPCFTELVGGGNVKYEIEHIWADHFERHSNEFQHQVEFSSHRNRIGGLLLLPKSFNASYGDDPYEKKLGNYFSQNILAQSLNVQCYENNPRFRAMMEKFNLPFEPIEKFTRESIDKRGELYRQIAKCVWNPDSLLDEV